MRAGAPSRVVLVVEDDYVVRSDILAQFQAQGWSVLDAATGEAALALLTDHRIDVVFTERCSGLRSGLAHCEYRYDLTDALTVPDALESALRKLPWATVDPYNCAAQGSATVCRVNFKIPAVTWRTVLAGCSVMFYGGLKDSVFENLSCSAVGPADGTITDAERQSLVQIRDALLKVAVDCTAQKLPSEQQAVLARYVLDAKGEKVRDREWVYSIDKTQFAPNVIGLSAWRDFETVTEEHYRRFCAK